MKNFQFSWVEYHAINVKALNKTQAMTRGLDNLHKIAGSPQTRVTMGEFAINKYEPNLIGLCQSKLK